MNNKGLLGLIAIIIIAVLVAGSGYVYFKFLGDGVQVGTGNVAIDIKLNTDGVQDPAKSKTDTSLENNSTQNNTDETITIGESDESNEPDSSSPPGHPGIGTLSPEQ
jgi:hypothetical protein